MNDGRMDPEGRGLTLAGVIISGLFMGVLVLFVGFIAVVAIMDPK